MADDVLYDANPPVLRNNLLMFILSVAALGVAGALSAEIPQLLLGVAALLILIWLILFVKSKSHRLIITTSEVRYEKGLLAKNRTELGTKRVRSIRIDQTFMQRILGVARVEFFSAGDVAEISVNGLPNPHQIREIVDG